MKYKFSFNCITLLFVFLIITPVSGWCQVRRNFVTDSTPVSKDTRNLPADEPEKKDTRYLPAGEEVKFELPAHSPTMVYAMGSDDFTEMKRQFANIYPLQISAIDASLWENDPHTITVYFNIKNNTLNPVSGYIEPAIGDADHPGALFQISRLQSGSEINGSIIINDAPPVCYDNSLQLTFFEVDTLGKIPQDPNSLNTPLKNPYNITIAQTSSDVSHLNFRTVTIDADHDFLDDKLEDFLLEKYRPYFKFSLHDTPEEYRPCDAYWYIRNSFLGLDYPTGSINTDNCPQPAGFDQSCLAADPNCLLTIPDPPDLFQYAGRTNYHLIPSDIAKQGNEWDEVLSKKNIGLYGHVVPVILNSPAEYQPRKIFPCPNTPNSRLYYKVEYWQFFGYNYAHGHMGGRDYGDHEGDWATVQLLIDAQSSNIVSLFYYAHGMETRFDIDPSITPNIINEEDGSSVAEYRGANAGEPADEDVADGGSGHDTRNNRRGFLYQPVNEFAYTHPLVYLENGSHEFWPTRDARYGVTKVGTRYFAAFHNGEDYAHSYLTSTPPNLGELEHPLDETNEANVIMRYSGFWGCYNVYNSNPPGPTLHTQWTYPFDSKLFHSYNEDLEW